MATDDDDNIGGRYMTIKTSLKSVIRNPEHIELLTNNAINVTSLTVHSLQFMKLYLLNYFGNHNDFPVINVQFVSNIIRCVGGETLVGYFSLVQPITQFYNSHYIRTLPHNFIRPNTVNLQFGIEYIGTKILTMVSQ
jgi:hypothetical protein